MAGVKFTGDFEGIGEMLCSPEMVAEMRRRAEAVKAVAVAAAPVYEQGPHPGRYKESITADAGVRQGKTRRAVGTVTADSPEAIIVEYGNSRTPRHRTLGRALDAAAD
jgi:hypothetical protein